MSEETCLACYDAGTHEDGSACPLFEDNKFTAVFKRKGELLSCSLIAFSVSDATEKMVQRGYPKHVILKGHLDVFHA